MSRRNLGDSLRLLWSQADRGAAGLHQRARVLPGLSLPAPRPSRELSLPRMRGRHPRTPH